MRTTSSFLALAAVAALLLIATPTAARLVVTDIDFDDRDEGQALDRRGALFDEPVPGPPFEQIERIVDQGGGDLAVSVLDIAVEEPSELYWDLYDGLDLTGGLLTARVEITPTEMGDLVVGIRARDFRTRLAEVLLVENSPSTYLLQWRDSDSPGPTVLGTASVGQTLALRLELDLDARHWNLWIDGEERLAAEPFDLVEPASLLATGHVAEDGDLDGAVEFDLVQMDWRPDDSVPALLVADFEDKPVGEELDLRGPDHGEPVMSVGDRPTVEIGPPGGTAALHHVDTRPDLACATVWEFTGGAEVSDGPVSVSFTYFLVEPQDTFISFYQSGSLGPQFLSLNFDPAGLLFFDDDAGGPNYHVVPYTARTTYRIEISFDPVRDVYSVWIDGERVVHERAHGITDRDMGWIYVGHSPDPDLGDAFMLDDLVVRTLGQVPTSVEDTTPQPLATATLAAAPNPFNPATEIRLDLPRSGPITLDVFDARGRHVRRLLDGDRPAGEHTLRWSGHDQTGRPLASGVYHLRLRSVAGVTTRAVTLVK
jgi:hypothetical protein